MELPGLRIETTSVSEQQYQARRRLVNIAATTRADNGPVTSELLLETSWVQAAKVFKNALSIASCTYG